MKPLMKAKQPEAPAKPYQSQGLVVPNPDERHFTPETLTAKLRELTGSEIEFCQERLVRARHRKIICVSALNEFRANGVPRDSKFIATMQRLEKAAAEAVADYEFAERAYSMANEAA